MKIITVFEEKIETFLPKLINCWTVLNKLRYKRLSLDIKYNQLKKKWIITIYNVS